MHVYMFLHVCVHVCVCAGADQFVGMPREEKRKLYKCGTKYTTLETITTLKEDIESGTQVQREDTPTSCYDACNGLFV